jgi:hypothetical protein
MLAVASEYRLQLVPNWNGMTMLETTPIEREGEDLYPEARDAEVNGLRVQRNSPRGPRWEASPIVNAGSRKWNAMTKANCSRDSKRIEVHAFILIFATAAAAYARAEVPRLGFLRPASAAFACPLPFLKPSESPIRIPLARVP